MFEGTVKITPSLTLRDYVERRGEEPDLIVEVHRQQVAEWFLRPARVLADRHNKDDGMALLALTVGFFEPHGCYWKGESTLKGDNKKRFNNGFKAFKKNWLTQKKHAGIDHTGYSGLPDIWDLARCALYHSQYLGLNLLIKSCPNETWPFRKLESPAGVWAVNPWGLLYHVERYFDLYVGGILLNPNHKQHIARRDNFGVYFDCLMGDAIRHYEGLISDAPSIDATVATVDGVIEVDSEMTGTIGPEKK